MVAFLDTFQPILKCDLTNFRICEKSNASIEAMLREIHASKKITLYNQTPDQPQSGVNAYC